MRSGKGLLLLLLVPVLLVGPVLLPGRVLFPYAPVLHEPWRAELEPELRDELEAEAVGSMMDKVLLHHVHNEAVRASLAAGEFPWWHPGVVGGIPLLGMVLPGVLYPLHAPFFLLPDPYDWYGWHLVLHLWIAGFGTWALLRRLGAGGAGAATGALVFALSGWMAARVHFHMLVSAAAWGPAMLWALHGICHRGRPRDAAAFALFTGLSLLAGFPGVTLVLLHLCAGIALVTLLRRVREQGLGAPLRAAGLVLGGLAGGLLLSLPQLLSGAEYQQRWARERPDETSWSWQSLEAPHLLSLLWPTAFGEVRGFAAQTREAREFRPELAREALLEPVSTAGSRSVDGRELPGTPGKGSLSANLPETTHYLGLLPLVLFFSIAFVGACRRAWLYLAAAVLAAGMAYGRSEVLTVARYLLPGAEIGPPSRYLLAFTLAASVFVGLQLDRVLATRRTGPFLAAGVLLAGLVGLLGTFALDHRDPAVLGRKLWQARLEAKTELHFGAEHVPVIAAIPDPIYADAFLEARDAARRAAFVTLILGAALWLAAERRRGAWLLAPALVAALDEGAFFREWIPSVRREHIGSEPAVVTALRERIEADPLGSRGRVARIGTFPQTGARADHLLPPNLLLPYGVDDLQGYTIPSRAWEELVDGIEPGIRRFGSGTWSPFSLLALRSPLYDRLGVRFALVPHPIPDEQASALLAEGWRVLGPGDDPRFVTEGFAVLENAQAYPTAWFEAEGAPVDSSPRGAHVRYRSPQRLELEIELGADEAGTLIANEGYAPGWTVQVDGEDAEVLPIDHALRGVRLSGAGAHVVSWKYVEPWSKRTLVAPLVLMPTLLLFWLGAAWRAARRKDA